MLKNKAPAIADCAIEMPQYNQPSLRV